LARTENAREFELKIVDEETEAVTPVEIGPHPVSSHTQTGWTVTYDDALITKFKQIRRAALPNETGGVLLEVADLKSKTILLVDTLPRLTVKQVTTISSRARSVRKLH
jgi:hypothetical protein